MADLGVIGLLSSAHRLDIKIILDLVPNHTSDKHPWFIESRSTRDNPKRDWYIWKPPAQNGGPPNNWLSTFGGSAWELDPRTGEYYYHAYLTQQPDLNWRHPEVPGGHASSHAFLARSRGGWIPYRCHLASHQG